MTIKRNLTWLILASCALSVAAADDDQFESEEYSNHFELGIGYTSDDNQKLGEFSKDLGEKGAFGEGALDYFSRADDGSSIIYIDVLKDVYNTSGSGGFVKPGNFSVEAYGSDSQKIEARDFFLPTTYVGNPDHTDIANFSPNDFIVERTTYGVTGKKYLGKSVMFKVNFQHQDKEGNKTMAGPDHGPVVGRAVNFEHDELSMGVEYAAGRLSLGANYYFSDFTDADHQFEYCDIGIACGSAIAAEPSNDFKRLETDGSFRLGSRTVLNWIGSWSTGKQDEYIVLATNPTRFDGEIDRTYGRITLTSAPMRNLNFKLEYAMREHETNHDPIRGLDVGYVSRGRSRRISSIYDKEQDTFKAELGYRLPNRSKLNIGWRRDDIERTRTTFLDDDFTPGQWEDETSEDVLWAEYRFSVARLQVKARVETADRDGEQNQNPDWQSIYNFDRDRDMYRVTGSLPIGDDVVLSAGYTSTKEDYSPNWEPAQMPGEYAGLDYRDFKTANVDLSFYMSEDLNVGLYALFTRFDHRQVASRFYASRAPRDDDEFEYNGKDKVNVFGLNVNWQASSRFTVEGSFAVSRNDNELATAGIFIPLQSNGEPAGPATAYDETLPGYGTDMTHLDLLARWRLNSTTSLYARFIYENWEVEDLTFTGELLHADGELAMAWDAWDGDNNAIILGLRKNF